MTIYILVHPQKNYTGLQGGIEFDSGIGSTNSEIDANNLVNKFKCEKMTLEEFKAQRSKKKTDAKEETSKKEEKKEAKEKAEKAENQK